jgi:hypothetical protein
MNNEHRNFIEFVHYHSLSLVTLAILIFWFVLYCLSDPNRHAGAFFGNSIADWSGSLVVILATKYLIERRPAKARARNAGLNIALRHFLNCHPFSLFLVITGVGWLVLYWRMDANSRWGQVVGNLLSEWLQTLGVVLMTKRLLERGPSKERNKQGLENP